MTFEVLSLGLPKHPLFNGGQTAKPLPTPPQQNQFSERQRKHFCASSWSLDTVNSNPDCAYRVESGVLFGSMLSEAEGLGDVDIAIELLPKVAEEAEFRKSGPSRTTQPWPSQPFRAVAFRSLGQFGQLVFHIEGVDAPSANGHTRSRCRALVCL
jgi:hypothetical protein